MQDKIQENPLTEEKKCCFPCCSCSCGKKIVCVIVGLLILAGAVYAGYLLGRRSLSPRELLIPPKPIATQIPIDNGPVEIEVSLTPDETANWKTYTNKLYKLQFKYPESFVLTDTLPDHQLYRALSPSEKIELTDKKDNLILSIYLDQAGFGPIFADKTLNVAYLADKGIYVVSSQENDIREYLETNKPKEYVIDTATFVPTENFGLFFVYSYQRGESNKEKLFDLILSTFKFLD